jgi:V-type H+-transporting ATPase subunit H
MFDNGVLKISDTLLKGNIKDAEVIEDIKSVAETLEQNSKILT